MGAEPCVTWLSQFLFGLLLTEFREREVVVSDESDNGPANKQGSGGGGGNEAAIQQHAPYVQHATQHTLDNNNTVFG